jgi:hypothetical protein
MSSDNDDRFDDDPRPSRDRFRKARSAVGLPATLLIVVGALSLLQAIVGLIRLGSLPAQMNQMIATIEADPNMPRDQKDTWIDILTTIKEVAEQPTALISYIVNILCAALVLIGGIKMLQLSGPGLPTISAILAMIPCTVSCCCCLGLPVGIWALVVLYRPDVRAAMAARKATTEYPDERDMR